MRWGFRRSSLAKAPRSSFPGTEPRRVSCTDPEVLKFVLKNTKTSPVLSKGRLSAGLARVCRRAMPGARQWSVAFRQERCRAQKRRSTPSWRTSATTRSPQRHGKEVQFQEAGQCRSLRIRLFLFKTSVLARQGHTVRCIQPSHPRASFAGRSER